MMSSCQLSKTHLILQSMQPPESQWCTILTHKPALRSVNVWQMVVFQWVLFAYYVYALGSGVRDEGEIRMVLYCVVFLLFDKLELSCKYLELEDPLHLGATINCIRYLTYLCMLDISLLLVRIVLQNQNLHAFLVVMHFILIMVIFLNEFSKKNIKLDINVDSNNLLPKFITPTTLFFLAQTNSLHPHEFWYLQLPFFAANLFISSELNRLLVLKECQYFGWGNEDSKEKGSWSRKRGLRNIIVVCCILIVIQNLLLLFDRIKYQISVTIVHSLIVSAVAYLLYLGKLPTQK